jgi:hypothetical protein
MDIENMGNELPFALNDYLSLPRDVCMRWYVMKVRAL